MLDKLADYSTPLNWLLVFTGAFVAIKEGYGLIQRWRRARTDKSKRKGLFTIIAHFGLAILALTAGLAGVLSSKITDEKISGLEAKTVESKERLGAVESTNLVLRTKLGELEIKTRARAITPNQVTNFKILTEKIPKVPIKITVGPRGADSDQFAYQLRLMLNQAGFLIPSNSGELGYNSDTAKVIVRDIAEITPPTTPSNVVRANMIDANGKPQWWSPWPDLVIVVYGPNQPYIFERSYLDERVDKFFRPIVSEANNRQVTEALYRVFEQIDVSVGWMHSTTWVKHGEFEIYIPSVRH